jgi:hypothetical protein
VVTSQHCYVGTANRSKDIERVIKLVSHQRVDVSMGKGETQRMDSGLELIVAIRRKVMEGDKYT